MRGRGEYDVSGMRQHIRLREKLNDGTTEQRNDGMTERSMELRVGKDDSVSPLPTTLACLKKLQKTKLLQLNPTDICHVSKRKIEVATTSMNGDVGSGTGSGEAELLQPQWLSVMTLCVAVFPFLTWYRRRRSISLLVLLSVLVSVGNHTTETAGVHDAIEPHFLGLISLIYACQINHPESGWLWLFGGFGLVLLGICDWTDLRKANGHVYEVVHAVWHVIAYLFVGLVPGAYGMLPLSVDDPNYYYEQRRQRKGRRRDRRWHVLVPRDEPWGDEPRQQPPPPPPTPPLPTSPGPPLPPPPTSAAAHHLLPPLNFRMAAISPERLTEISLKII